MACQPGKSFPLGTTLVPGGANFSVFAKHSTGTQLLLFGRTISAAGPMPRRCRGRPAALSRALSSSSLPSLSGAHLLRLPSYLL